MNGDPATTHIQQLVPPNLLQRPVHVHDTQAKCVGKDILCQRDGKAVAVDHANRLQAAVKLQYQVEQSLVGRLAAEADHLIPQFDLVSMRHPRDRLSQPRQRQTCLVRRS